MRYVDVRDRLHFIHGDENGINMLNYCQQYHTGQREVHNRIAMNLCLMPLNSKQNVKEKNKNESIS